MKANSIKILLIIFFITILSGCWDSKGVRYKNIVTTVIVDKTDVGYAFYVEIASLAGKTTENQGSSGRENIVIHAEGKDFAEAKNDIDSKSNKTIYLGGDQCVVLTKKMAQTGIAEYIFRLRTIPEYRKTVNILITEVHPEELLKADIENERQVGIAIKNLIQNRIEDGQLIKFVLADVLERLASPCKHFVVPVLGLQENRVHISGYEVFNGDVSEGFIPLDESLGLTMLLADKHKGIIAVDYQQVKFTIDYKITKRKYDVTYKDGIPYFTLTIGCKAELLYIDKDIAVNEQIIKGVAEAFKAKIKQEIGGTFIKSRDVFGHDYLDLFTPFRIKYPDLAKKIDWPNVYPQSEMLIGVNMDLEYSSKIDYNKQ